MEDTDIAAYSVMHTRIGIVAGCTADTGNAVVYEADAAVHTCTVVCKLERHMDITLFRPAVDLIHWWQANVTSLSLSLALMEASDHRLP